MIKEQESFVIEVRENALKNNKILKEELQTIIFSKIRPIHTHKNLIDNL